MTALWGDGPVPMSRQTMLAMIHGEAVERAEQREREQAAEARREAAEAAVMRYHAEHGEWEWETRARETELAARREQLDEKRAAAGRAERAQQRYAEMIASGQQPRTVAEVLGIAQLYP